MILSYVISFIIGGLIGYVLYGKVPLIISLIMAIVVGVLIGYIYFKIQRKKAEREYFKWRIDNGFIDSEKTES